MYIFVNKFNEYSVYNRDTRHLHAERLSYSGGYCEVQKPLIKNGVFIDITSSYPAVMSGNGMPTRPRRFEMHARA